MPALKNDCVVLFLVLSYLYLWVCFIAKVIIDIDSRRSRRFGFANFSNDEFVSSALSAMDGKVKVLFSLY